MTAVAHYLWSFRALPQSIQVIPSYRRQTTLLRQYESVHQAIIFYFNTIVIFTTCLRYTVTNYRNYKSIGIGFTKIKNCNLQLVAGVFRGGHFLKPLYYTTIPLHQLMSSFLKQTKNGLFKR